MSICGVLARLLLVLARYSLDPCGIAPGGNRPTRVRLALVDALLGLVELPPAGLLGRAGRRRGHAHRFKWCSRRHGLAGLRCRFWRQIDRCRANQGSSLLLFSLSNRFSRGSVGWLAAGGAVVGRSVAPADACADAQVPVRCRHRGQGPQHTLSTFFQFHAELHRNPPSPPSLLRRRQRPRVTARTTKTKMRRRTASAAARRRRKSRSRNAAVAEAASRKATTTTRRRPALTSGPVAEDRTKSAFNVSSASIGLIHRIVVLSAAIGQLARGGRQIRPNCCPSSHVCLRAADFVARSNLCVIRCTVGSRQSRAMFGSPRASGEFVYFISNLSQSRYCLALPIIASQVLRDSHRGVRFQQSVLPGTCACELSASDLLLLLLNPWPRSSGS